MGFGSAANAGKEEAIDMIPAPRQYSEWVTVIELFKGGENDTDVLEAMQHGELEWQSGVAERFSKRLIDAVNHRMNEATDKFQKDMGRTMGSESSIVRAILAVRKEMRFLSAALDLPVLPAEHREKLQELVQEQADKMQHSLEDSAKRDRSGKLLSIVRNNKVNSLKGV